MNLYLVSTAEHHTELWVAYETINGNLYIFVQNTGKFHRNVALEEDFYITQEFIYKPITAVRARKITEASQVGTLNIQTKTMQIQRYKIDSEAMDAKLILMLYEH